MRRGELLEMLLLQSREIDRLRAVIEEMKAEAEGEIVGFTFVAQIVVLLLEVTSEQEEAETG